MIKTARGIVLLTPIPSRIKKAASIIVDAILFDPQVVQLVARFDGNALEMNKDWELMFELEKDELPDKKIVREL